jgi:hypothetical protein
VAVEREVLVVDWVAAGWVPALAGVKVVRAVTAVASTWPACPGTAPAPVAHLRPAATLTPAGSGC